MFSATSYTIRLATVDDDAALRRIAAIDSQRPLANGPVLGRVRSTDAVGMTPCSWLRRPVQAVIYSRLSRPRRRFAIADTRRRSWVTRRWTARCVPSAARRSSRRLSSISGRAWSGGSATR
jgi:hypothetical protein